MKCLHSKRGAASCSACCVSTFPMHILHRIKESISIPSDPIRIGMLTEDQKPKHSAHNRAGENVLWLDRKVIFAYENRTHVKIGKCENAKMPNAFVFIVAGDGRRNAVNLIAAREGE